jgi:hypothetical protein
MGTVLNGMAMDTWFRTAFVDEVVYNLQHPEILKQRQEEVQRVARVRFAPETIMEQWNQLVFNKG